MKFILFAILSYLFYRIFVTPFLSSLTGESTHNPSNINNHQKPNQSSSDDEYLDYEEVE